jgi:transposase-like protein
LPEFQRLFPTDDDCAVYLEMIKWPFGFMCPTCHAKGEPYRFAGKPALLRCRACKRNTSITVGTVMERTHIELSTWFWGAYLLSSMTPGMSAVQFQRQLGLGRYETAFQILHKLRAGMVRSDRDRIGTGSSKDHVEIDETNIGGRTRGEGRGVHHQTLVIAAVEVKQRAPNTKDKRQNKAVPRRGGRYAGRLRLDVVPNRTAKALTKFVTSAVEPGSMVITDDWSGYDKLSDLGYQHLPVAERGDPQVAEDYLPIVHLIFSNMKAWLNGVHHGVAPQHLQAYLNEFTFRFNRRFYPFNAFRSLLGIGGDTEAPTYAELYSGDWQHPTVSGHG